MKVKGFNTGDTEVQGVNRRVIRTDHELDRDFILHSVFFQSFILSTLPATAAHRSTARCGKYCDRLPAGLPAGWFVRRPRECGRIDRFLDRQPDPARPSDLFRTGECFHPMRGHWAELASSTNIQRAIRAKRVSDCG